MIDKFLSKLRNTMFWTLDSIKGNPIKSAYNEIQLIDRLASDEEYLDNYKKVQFEKLAQHASNTTKFYSEFKNKKSLVDFPVINKDIIRKDQDNFLSINYDKNKLFQMSTSGSTGTPFISYQDKLKKRRVNAEIIYYSEVAGYSVGKNLIFLRAITDQSYKSSLKQFIQNESLIDISNLSDISLEEISTHIVKKSKSGSILLAYASTYDALKDYVTKNTNNILKQANVTGIISSSEMLYDDTREAMKEVFKCNVYSRYSNQENGVIGQDYEDNNVFIINEANYIVEIFDLDEDILVPEGVVGRIVITDLYNYAMPMIRYDTGDIGAVKTIQYKGVLKKAITNFGGRRVDVVYDYYGNRLSPHVITNNLWSFPEIKQYQFIQEKVNQYRIKISSEDKFERKTELLEVMKELLGNKAKIQIELVDEIPIMDSGKRKAIVNEIG